MASREAPPIRFFCNARTNAAVSMMEPRAVLIRMAVGRIRASWSLPIRCRVAGVSGMCRLSTSAWASSYIKLGRRNALAISRMNVAVVLVIKGGKITEARISPGSTTPTPDRITTAEELLLGKEPAEELFRRAGKAVSEEMINRSGRRWSTPYKEPVIAALTTRALNEAAGRKE